MKSIAARNVYQWQSINKARPEMSLPNSGGGSSFADPRLARRFSPVDALAIAILALVAVISLATFRDYGMGWDDPVQAQYGDLLVAFYSSGFRDTRAFHLYNLYMYGGGFDAGATLLSRFLPLGEFETRRLFGAVVGLFGLFLVWRLGRRIHGPLAGFLALILLAVCPFYFGHMFINPKDSPFAVTMVLALLGMVRAIEEYPRPRAATIVLFGLGLGLAIGSRIMGGFLILYAFGALMLIIVAEVRSRGTWPALMRLRAFLFGIFPSLIIALCAMAAVWPWSVFKPLNLLQAIRYFSHFFERPWRDLFAGDLILVTDMPRIYVPVLLGVTLPELFLALGVAGIVGALAITFRRNIPVLCRATYFCVLLASTLPVAYAIARRPAMYNGIRHFEFIIPFIAVLGGGAASYLVEISRRFGRPISIAVWAVLIVGIASPIVEMIRLHPYQYVYFNQITGGLRGANGRFMLDYWGLSFKEASEKLNAILTERRIAPSTGQKWKIAVCGPLSSAAIELGEHFDVDRETKDADFALMLGSHFCAKLDAPVLVDITREGVSLSRVYDTRGLTFPSVLSPTASYVD